MRAHLVLVCLARELKPNSIVSVCLSVCLMLESWARTVAAAAGEAAAAAGKYEQRKNAARVLFVSFQVANSPPNRCLCVSECVLFGKTLKAD